MNRTWIPQIVVSGMLLWALNPGNPYSYYILLRWFCCAVFAFLAIQAFATGKQGCVWVLGVTAAIYNPLVPVHLTREIWSVINVLTIGVAIASIFAVKSTEGRTLVVQRQWRTGRFGLSDALRRLAGALPNPTEPRNSAAQRSRSIVTTRCVLIEMVSDLQEAGAAEKSGDGHSEDRN